MKRLSTLALLAVCSSLNAAGPAGKGGMPPPAVEVLQVKAGDIEDSITAIGSLRANEAVVLKPEVSGRVTRIGFTEGSAVKAGQVLVQLDDELVRADLAQARANLSLAQSEFKRASELVAGNLVSKTDFERKRTELDVAKAAVQRAEAQLAKTRIVAPFSGVSGLRQFSPGDMVQPGQSLVSVVSTQPMKVDVRVPETWVSRVRAGQPVTVTSEAVPGQLFKGQVMALEPQVEAGGRALAVRARVDNRQNLLRPGMSARVNFVTGKRSGAVLVPEQALVAQGKSFVIYRFANGMATSSPVKVGSRRPGWVEIVSGISVGDTIVVSGQNKIPMPSMPVRAVPFAGGR